MTGKQIMHATGSSQEESLSWSPDSKKIVTSGAQIWNATSGTLLFTYQDGEPYGPISWSPDGKFIAGGGDETIYVWDTTTYQYSTQYNGNGQGSFVSTIAWSPDGKFIAASYVGSSGIAVWDTNTGELINQEETGSTDGFGGNIAGAPDSKKIASPGPDNIKIWQPTTQQSFPSIAVQGISCVAWSPDGTQIASGATTMGKGIMQI